MVKYPKNTHTLPEQIERKKEKEIVRIGKTQRI